jgi:Uma2 family endonuclease
MATVTTKQQRKSRRQDDGLPSGITLDRHTIRIPASAGTHAGFRAWTTSDDFPYHVRPAFINQEIFIDMSGEELETHSQVKSEVNYVLIGLNREQQLGKYYPDGAQVSNEAVGLSSIPDGVLVKKASLQSGLIRMVPRKDRKGQYVELEGRPDWLMEIVSDSSVHKDTVDLRHIYHQARIPEYWIIDARGDEIVFRILHYRRTGYAAAPKRNGWQRSQVFNCSFRLTRQRDDLGLWEYTLHVQPADPA